MYTDEIVLELKNAIIYFQKVIDKINSNKIIESANIEKNKYIADELLTTTEVGKLLKCNRGFVYKLLDTGLLPYMWLGSRKVRVSAINEFLQKYEGWDLTDPYNPKPIRK